MIKEIIESIQKKDLKVGDMVLVNGKWYVVDEIEGNIVWASDDDGESYEIKIKDIEKVERD